MIVKKRILSRERCHWNAWLQCFYIWLWYILSSLSPLQFFDDNDDDHDDDDGDDDRNDDDDWNDDDDVDDVDDDSDDYGDDDDDDDDDDNDDEDDDDNDDNYDGNDDVDDEMMVMWMPTVMMMNDPSSPASRLQFSLSGRESLQESKFPEHS